MSRLLGDVFQIVRGNVGIGTTLPTVSLDIQTTDALHIPSGSNVQRPTGRDGLIRYNTQLRQFEGYSKNEWGAIGGGGESYWSCNQNTLFYSSNNVGIGTNNAQYRLDVKGTIRSENIWITGNLGIGTTLPYVSLDIQTTDALHIPSGSNVQRPNGQDGYIRYNTELQQFEGYSKNEWGAIGGVSDWTSNYSSNSLYYTTGRIGIGTTLASYTLDVYGTIRTSNIILTGSLIQPDVPSIIRNRLQLKPLTIQEQISTPTVTFSGYYDGLYKAHSETTDVFLNGRKLMYRSSNEKDYTLTYSYDTSNQQSLFTITLEETTVYGDLIDIAIWPDYDEGISFLQPGYILQNITYPSSVDTSNLIVYGKILPSTCNIYDLGSSNLRFRDLYLSGNTIDLDGTRISRSITGGVKLTSGSSQLVDIETRYIYSSNIGIGTTLIGSGMNLDVIGNARLSGSLTAGSLLGSAITDSVSTTSSSIAASATAVKTSYDLANNALPKIGGTVTGNVNISGNLFTSNLTVIGDYTTLNTITSNTEQMVIENAGTGPALKVTQSGLNSVAEFYDKESGIALFVGNGGNVGIGTTIPTTLLDVSGHIKTSQTIRTTNGYFISDQPYAFQVRGSNSQSQSGAAAIVPFNTIIYDPQNMFNTTTSIWTVPIKGVYNVSYNVTCNHSANALYYIELNIAGSTRTETRMVNNIITTPNINSTCSASFVLQLNSNEQVKVFCNSSPTPITWNGLGSSFNGALLYALP